MIFNSIIFVLIILITLYMSTQGMLSSLLALATAIFSSILAMGLLEPLQGIVGGWQSDYARGLTFLALFLAIFAVTRVLADVIVPKNIKVGLWVNRIAGGLVGIFAALVIMGTLVIGIEMLPLPTKILDFQRFPEETGMKADAPGVATSRTNGIWLNPDGFVKKIWNGASAGGLGGNRAWASVHPNISAESWGYRYTVTKASQRSVPADLFTAPDAWYMSGEAPELQALGIPSETGKRIAMIRTVVKKGDKEPHITSDPGNDAYFRVSATQVRLVTDKQQQYYPIGYLEKGRKFVPMSLDSGHLVDDYVNNAVVEDWVFQIRDDEKPAVIEMKQFGRRIFAEGDVKQAATPAYAAADYPQHPYLNGMGSVTVNLNLNGRKLVEAHVYLIKPGIKFPDIRSEILSAKGRVENVQSYIQAGSNGWSTQRKAGVPSPQFINGVGRNISNLTTSENTATISWSAVLPLLFLGQVDSSGERNVVEMPKYVEARLVPIWKGASDGNMLLDSATTTGNEPIVLNRVQPGSKSILVTARTERAFFVWLTSHEFERKDAFTFDINADDANAVIKIDLDEKIPAGN